jgi:hypothetical protein
MSPLIVLTFFYIAVIRFKIGLETACMEKLTNSGPSIVKDFLKADGTLTDGFSKAAGDLVKKSVKNRQPQRLSKALLLLRLRLSKSLKLRELSLRTPQAF